MAHSTPLLAAVAAAAAVLAAPTAAAKDKWNLEGHFELDFEHEENFDLDTASAEDFTTLEAELRVRLEYAPVDGVQFNLQVRPRRKFDLHEEDHERDRVTELQLEEAYMVVAPPGSGVEIQIGRTEFKDKREWIYDENLDGVRVGVTAGKVGIEASITRETLISADLLRTDKEDPVNNYHVYADYPLNDDNALAAWWMGRWSAESGSDSHTQFFGLRAMGEAFKGLEYHLELAYAGGHEDGADISGFAADAGVYYTADAPLKPFAVLGYAFGSGDGDPADGTDHNFRQTDLQDNNGRTGTANKYQYYGEMLEPELSNIHILSAGGGFWPAKHLSAAFLYHRYSQHRAADFLRDSNLDDEPLGLDRDLGEEFDVVIGYYKKRRLRIKATAGWFRPGDAFAATADDAVFGGLEVRIYY